MEFRNPFPYGSQFSISGRVFARIPELTCRWTVGYDGDGERSELSWHIAIPFLISLFVTIPIPFTTCRFYDRETGEKVPRPTAPGRWENVRCAHPMGGERWPKVYGFYIHYESACIDSLSFRLSWGEPRDAHSRGWPRRSWHCYPMELLFGEYKMTRTVIFADDWSYKLDAENIVPGTMEVSVDSWSRQRFAWFPFTYELVRAHAKSEPSNIVLYGKGENSWDCDNYTLRIDSTFPVPGFSPLAAVTNPHAAAEAASWKVITDKQDEISERGRVRL